MSLFCARCSIGQRPPPGLWLHDKSKGRIEIHFGPQILEPRRGTRGSSFSKPKAKIGPLGSQIDALQGLEM